MISISAKKSGMAQENHYLTTEFILIGFTDHPVLKILLVLVFFAIYLTIMVGNLGLMALIFMEHHLHMPMYIFMGNLALMNSCYSCAFTLKMLENLFFEDRMISLNE